MRANDLPVLGRMAEDLETSGRLRASTGAMMWAAYGGGVALCVAGMQRFVGVRTVAAAEQQPLVTGGVYRWSRNPQYVGYVLALGGLATARRSLPALALTGAVAAVYALWVPLEEHQLRTVLGQPYVDYASRTARWWSIRPRAAGRG